MASNVRTSRVPPPSTSCSSSSVTIWYGSTPGTKSTMSPPARSSSERTSTEKPSGPHQASIPSLVVQSSHTSWMGALNVRSRVSFGLGEAKWLAAAVCVLQLRDVELLHLQHRLHCG